MLRAEKSKLDCALFELAHTSNAADLLISHTGDQLPIGPNLIVEVKQRRRGRAKGFSPKSPTEHVTVKLIAAAGETEQLESELHGHGIEIISRGPQVLLANLQRDKLAILEELSGLLRAEQSRRMNLLLNKARGTATRTDIALRQHPNLTGEGVVVGVIDSGIDWRHTDFRHTDGQTRVERFIHAATCLDTGKDTFREFSANDINAALVGAKSLPLGDRNGHGTHCASIAAGNGRALRSRKYRGIAPDATLMVMRSDTLHDTHIINGIRRIFEHAGDRPAVINLSIGGHVGPHDGTSALENVIARESGSGRIVVVAAGNEGQDRIHFQGQLVEGRDLDVEFTIRDAVQTIDVWIPRGDEVDVIVVDAHGVQTLPDGGLQETGAGSFRAVSLEDHFNRDINLRLAVAARELGRRWCLRLSARKVQQGSVHAWAQTSDPAASQDIFMSQSSQRFSIGIPATEERAISVASFVSEPKPQSGDPSEAQVRAGQISPFSSHGPARHGAMRPDIAAPGQYISAALASGSIMATDPGLAAHRLAGDKYTSSEGTSMAAPFVAGVIALMLQQNPNLTPEEIQMRLRATATRDSDTGKVWNPGFGYGKIDVEALLNYASAK